MDSPDLLATIQNIRKTGTQDEKDWALFLRAACLHVRGVSIAADSASAASGASDAKVENSEVAVERQHALVSLKERCKGIMQLSPEESTALQTDLIAGADTNKSILGQLHALALSQESRWTDDQAKLVTSAIYSGDPLAQRAAFFVLQGAIDKSAPGGEDRSRALELAFPEDIVSGQLSDFERLGACYVISLCESNADEFKDHRPVSGSIERLEAQYRTALQNHVSARDILAIH